MDRVAADLVVCSGDVRGGDVSWMVSTRTHSRLAESAKSASAPSAGRRSRVSLVDHQVDRHFTLQTADVSVTEVVAQFVNLHNSQDLRSVQLSPNHRTNTRMATRNNSNTMPM